MCVLSASLDFAQFSHPIFLIYYTLPLSSYSCYCPRNPGGSYEDMLSNLHPAAPLFLAQNALKSWEQIGICLCLVITDITGIPEGLLYV